MKKIKKPLFFIVLGLVCLLVLGYELFQVSKSRNFQFFGTLVSHVSTDINVVALTFDDAPTEYTDEVLQTLAETDTKATFFAIGQNIEKHPDVAKRIVAAGHELGNHTYSHKRMLLKSQTFIQQEIEKTNQLIRDSGYKGEIYFRSPNGKKLFGLPWYLSQHNMTTVTWDVEPDTYGNTKDFLINHAVEHTQPGSIILLHPFCKGCENDRAAIRPIIEKLKAKGYRFVTISQLLTFDGIVEIQ